MKRINPEWVNAIREVVNPCPYFNLQTMEIKEITYGKSILEIYLQEKHLQPFGVVHGGVFASLIDAAGFWAVFSQAEQGTGMTTVELKLNYLAPAIDGTLTGYGKCLKLGKTLGLGEARIEDRNGRLLAHGTTTLIVQPDMKLDNQDDAPPKFK